METYFLKNKDGDNCSMKPKQSNVNKWALVVLFAVFFYTLYKGISLDLSIKIFWYFAAINMTK